MSASDEELPQEDAASVQTLDTGNTPALRQQIIAATDQLVALLAEQASIADRGPNHRRRREIGEEIVRQTQLCNTLDRMLTHQVATQSHEDPVPLIAPVSAAALGQSSRILTPRDLPKFRCGPTPIEEPNQFLHQFEQALLVQDLDLDKHWARFLPSCLHIDIAEWVKDNLVSTRTWDEVKDAFLLQFDDPARVLEARQAIYKMRMKTGESLSAYTQRFEKQMRMARVPESDKLAASYFRETLPPELLFSVENALQYLKKPDPTVKDLIKVALSYSWKPKNARLPSGSGGEPDDVDKTPPQVKSKQLRCRLHGEGNHATDECRVLIKNKNRSKHARNTHAVASTSAAPAPALADPFASTPRVKCHLCQQEGHYANVCPRRKPTSTGDHPVVKRINIMPAGNRAPAANDVIVSKNLPPILFPILLDEEEHTSEFDPGASCALISERLAVELGKTIEPRDGHIQLAISEEPASRIGLTSAIRIQLGPLDIMYRCEVASRLEGAQFLFGRDLIELVGYDYFRLLFRLREQGGDASDLSICRPISLIAPDFSKEEESPGFQRFRESVLQAIHPELAANAAIPRSEFCPMPEAEVHLAIEPGKSTFRRQFTLARVHYTAIDAKIMEWLEDGVIEEVTSQSTFNTPFFLVDKKDATGAKTDFRICHDFRPLNALLPDDASPIPLISDIFQAVNGAQVFSTLDLRQAYHRFPIALGDRYKTAFTWNDQQYQFRGAPFGLKILPSQFQRVMMLVFRGIKYVRVFIDDIVVFSQSRSDHAAHLAEVVRRLNRAKLILNVSKCHFARLEIKLLGFRISPYGRSIDPAQLANLADWPMPATAKQLQSFLGFVNYLREYIPNISVITAPLHAIRAKDDFHAQWTPECARAVQLLKELIPQCPPLAQPDFSRPFCVATDASAVGIGAVLYQLDSESGAPRYISFQARTLSSSERNYSATKRELLAVVFAFARFHHFIYGRRFCVYSDHHALIHLQTQPRLNSMMQNWYQELFEYDFVVYHRPGIQNVLPDRLSRLFPPSGLEGESGSKKPAAHIAKPTPPRQLDSTIVKKAVTVDPDRPCSEPPPDQRADIILQHHLRGHFGTKATIDAIREAGFDWPNMTAQAKEVCAKCLPCQRHNIAKRGYHPLSPIAATQPFDHVAIDLSGPFPTSPRGNHYLFVLVDIHTRFVCLRAMPDKKMATVGATLFDVFTAFGFPKIVQSDNGAEFVNSVLEHLFAGAKVDHRLITPYHPRANGIAERTVQTSVSTIKKLLDGAHKDWDMTVPFVQYAMNAKVAAIHKSTPFAVLFGRSANLFADFSSTPETSSTPTDVEARVQFMQESLFPGIADLSRAAKDAMKSSFDTAHMQIDIPTDSYVMVRGNTRRRKLDPRFEGPFKVVGKSGSAYTLQDNTGALLPRNYPPSALKLISADPVLTSESYVVEAILNHRQVAHGYEYLVRWKNYSKEHDSWEPAANFDDEATITNYWSRRKKSAAVASADAPPAGGE